MELALKSFSSPTFNPENFVKELCQRCVSGVELQQERNKIQTIADETNNLLKKNVFINYELFINTSKEISRLEGDMYQLSHLLSEGRSLLAMLSPMLDNKSNPLLSDSQTIHSKDNEEDESNEIKRKRDLSDVAEKVEGCINLTESSGRCLLYEGDLEELDVLDNSSIRKLHCYLLSDVVLLTTCIVNRRTPACYKLQTVYDVSNLAVVNVKDIKNAFKLLAFPDTRVFQTTSSQSKKEWLEKFEEAKKVFTAGQCKKRNSISMDQKSPTRTNSIELSANPFEEDIEEIDEPPEIPEWLLEIIEELDVLIVERHFENAYTLIDKTKKYLKETGPSDLILLQDISCKLDMRIKALTQMLIKELQITPNKSHQGGLRAARRIVKLLNTLNKSTQACDLFLKLSSSLLKSQLKRVKRDVVTSAYVKQLSAVFFSNLFNITKEFQHHCFPDNPSCTSAFVVWCIHEINFFMNQVVTQVFVPQNSLEVIAECVASLHTYGNQLTELGVDMIYQVDGQLRTPITRALFAARDKMIESIKINGAEDTWQPMNLKTSQQREKLINEFNSIELYGLEKHLIGDCYLEMTNNTITFCRLYITFLNNCLAAALPNIIDDVEQVLCDVLLPFTRHINHSLNNTKFESKISTIKANVTFLLETFFPYCQDVFEKYVDMHSIKFNQLKINFKESTSVSVSVTGYV